MCKTNEMTLYAVGDCIVYMLYCTCVTFAYMLYVCRCLCTCCTVRVSLFVYMLYCTCVTFCFIHRIVTFTACHTNVELHKCLIFAKSDAMRVAIL